jgi:hypothetical protein
MSLDISFGCSFGVTKVTLPSNVDLFSHLHPGEVKEVLILDNEDQRTLQEYAAISYSV